MFSAEPAEVFPAAPIAVPEVEVLDIAAPAPMEVASEGTAPRQSVGLNLLGEYLCLVLASAGANILIEGL
jgi:hypothetical protein